MQQHFKRRVAMAIGAAQSTFSASDAGRWQAANDSVTRTTSKPTTDLNGAARSFAELSPVEQGQLLSGRYQQAETRPSTATELVQAAPKWASPTRVTAAADLRGIATPADAPNQIRLPATMERTMDQQWRSSNPGATSLEHGGTVVADNRGNLSIQNIGGLGATPGSFTPDMTINDPASYSLVGIFHTHPYGSNGPSGVSFSGQDMGILINDSSQSLALVRSGGRDFALVRTGATPATVDLATIDNAQNARISELRGQGYTFQQSSRIAAQETARAYGLAYYQGSNGVLNRVD
jgi:hypothetical protein